jgi:hypothetical protein
VPGRDFAGVEVLTVCQRLDVDLDAGAEHEGGAVADVPVSLTRATWWAPAGIHRYCVRIHSGPVDVPASTAEAGGEIVGYIFGYAVLPGARGRPGDARTRSRTRS